MALQVKEYSIIRAKLFSAFLCPMSTHKKYYNLSSFVCLNSLDACPSDYRNKIDMQSFYEPKLSSNIFLMFTAWILGSYNIDNI